MRCSQAYRHSAIEPMALACFLYAFSMALTSLRAFLGSISILFVYLLTIICSCIIEGERNKQGKGGGHAQNEVSAQVEI